MKKSALILVILALLIVPSILSARWIKDKVYLQTDAVGKVEFSHYTHMQMPSVGKNCPTCHNDIYHIVTKKNPAYTMQEMEDGKACGVCHNDKQAFTVAENCTTCHAGDVAITYGASEQVVFSHDVHIDMFSCDECHPDLFTPESSAGTVSMDAMEDGESCGACHDGDTAFGVSSNCGSCHQGAEDIAIKSPVGVITFSHDIHTDMFGCDECHPDLFRAKANSNQVGMAAMEDGESCGACHDSDTAFGVSGDCTTCHTNAVEISIRTENVGTVPFSHEIHIDMFGCGECHPDLFKAQANSNQVGMDAMKKGESCGACHDGDTAFGVSGDCTTCHAGDILYKNEDAGDITFPHAAHIDMFGCEECHPDLFTANRGANPATMEEMENGESCGACHDGDTAFGVAEECESCHAM